jgi:glycyl-tRNA synthetase beta subunit
MNRNELTNEEQIAMQLFSVICAVLQSNHTSLITIAATMQTLEKIFNDESGPFMDNENSREMTVAMIEAANNIVRNREKKMREEEGADILGNINWN